MLRLNVKARKFKLKPLAQKNLARVAHSFLSILTNYRKAESMFNERLPML